MATVAEELVEKHAEILAAMMSANPTTEYSSEDEVKQFLEGFLGLLTAGAKGDLGPRDYYLNTIIPAVKQGGVPLSVTMAGMIRASMPITAVLSAEHHAWVIDFCADYTVALTDVWEKS